MSEEIDDSFYNRQRYVLGDTAMRLLSESNIYLFGLNGLGIEIAKNLVLGGVKDLTVEDNVLCSDCDVGTNFYVKNENVSNLTRAKASIPKLKELNPHVNVKLSNTNLMNLVSPMKDEKNQTILNELKNHQCIILTNCNLIQIGIIQNFCRIQSIKLIIADVIGLFGVTFCDFGPNFISESENDEETVEFFIEHIENSQKPKLRTLNGDSHGLKDGDIVTFTNIEGMVELNNKDVEISVISKSEIILNYDTLKFGKYIRNGICKQKKTRKVISFESFYDQSYKPSIINPDFCRLELSHPIVLLFLALKDFLGFHGEYPKEKDHFEEVKEKIYNLAGKTSLEITPDIDSIISSLISCSSGQLQPLAAVFGGVVAQEAIKAVTHRFTPIKQWMVLELSQLAPDQENEKNFEYLDIKSRYKNLEQCVGKHLLKKLQELRVFMVGCGAIGCELLKNMAMLGISANVMETKEDNSNEENGESSKIKNVEIKTGLIQITDNDLIEKSNLNRQFLFKERHIQHSKSEIARQSVLEMNPHLNIVADQNLVCGATEHIYTNDFIKSFDICLNALDNVEGRRYMDSRCLSNQVALLESGTMSTKGHVQVILPFLTETYSKVSDPVDNEIPYCTLKSFPAKIEHCVEWGREKFQYLFCFQPYTTKNFIEHKQKENEDDMINYKELYATLKFLKKRPKSYKDCVQIARKKFEAYYNHKALQLLHNFPLSTKSDDGTYFWQLPKRPPTHIDFDIKNPLHWNFIKSYSNLLAEINCHPKIDDNDEECQESTIMKWVQETEVPRFVPSNRVIITDETVKKPVETEMNKEDMNDEEEAIQFIDQYIRENKVLIKPLEFNKDNDNHIAYIAAVSNLRAAMYSIDTVDTYAIKKMSGRIIPAIATSTSVIAGLVCVELLKVVCGCPLSDMRNTFINLSSTDMIMSEPGEIVKEELLRNDGTKIQISIWDIWNIEEKEILEMKKAKESRDVDTVSLHDLVQFIEIKYCVTPTMVLDKSRIIYFNHMGSDGKMKQLLRDLLSFTSTDKYVDLLVSYAGKTEDCKGPPVRYWFMK